MKFDQKKNNFFYDALFLLVEWIKWMLFLKSLCASLFFACFVIRGHVWKNIMAAKICAIDDRILTFLQLYKSHKKYYDVLGVIIALIKKSFTWIMLPYSTNEREEEEKKTFFFTVLDKIKNIKSDIMMAEWKHYSYC